MFKIREFKLSELYNHLYVKLKPSLTSVINNHEKEKNNFQARRN